MTIQFITNSIIANWQKQCSQFQKVLDGLSNEQLKQDIATGKNSGIYILGHLIAANENILTLLDLGEKQYPELANIFIHTPDKLGQQMFEPDTLRTMWKETANHLTQHFIKMESSEWFTKHTAVSAEDFEKDPTRNKLSILLTRTQHQAYHLGQLILLK